MKQISLIIFILVSVLGYSQTGIVKGQVKDGDMGEEPLAFSNVVVKGTTTGANCDIDGNYQFTLSPGDYILQFSFLGYETQEHAVTIVADQTQTLDVVLDLEGIVVVLKASTVKDSQSALQTIQQNAVSITESKGAKELSEIGVGSAGGAVAKISGISKAEGSSNVYVRGLGDRYQNTTLNGLPMPSNDINRKNIDLGLFSTDVIENVGVSKTYSPKFYGDFAAGNVNIKSKEYKGKGFFDITVGTGFNTNAIGEDFVRAEGTGYFGFYNRQSHDPFAVILSHGVDPDQVSTPMNIAISGSAGKSFDFDNGSKLSLFATVGFDNYYLYREGAAIDFGLVENKGFDKAEEFEYGTNTTAMANILYRIDDNNTLKYNSIFINSSKSTIGYFGIDGQGRNRDGLGDGGSDEGFYVQNIQFNQDQIYVNQLGGEHKAFEDKLKVDWNIGVNVVDANEPDRKRIAFKDYQYAFDNDPSTNPTFFDNNAFDNQRYFQNVKDEEVNSLLKFAYDFSENTKLNFGFNGRTKERSFENYRYGYDILNDNYTFNGVNNINSLINLDNLSTDNGVTGFYDINVVRPFPDAPSVNYPSPPENTYAGNLDNYGFFASAEFNLGEKWLLVPGVRYELFDQDITWDTANASAFSQDNIGVKENLFLPSLNTRYKLNDDMNLRFSASESISLPEFKEAAPFTYVGVTTRIGGNPDILGTRDAGINYVNVSDVSYSKILNLDLKYEWFMSKNELVSIAAFAKQINDPINRVVANDATGTQRYFRTGDKAEIYGVEVEVKKNLVVVEDAPILSAGLNATYMHTKQDLFSTIEGTYNASFSRSSDDLQGASPFIFNANLSYKPEISENYKPTANLVFTYFADRIDALGSGQLGNIVEKSVPTLDFVLKNKISDKFEVNFKARNLTNSTIKYVRETPEGDILVTSPNGKGVTNYKAGVTLGLQLKYSF